jgi:ankyrin repeat protein
VANDILSWSQSKESVFAQTIHGTITVTDNSRGDNIQGKAVYYYYCVHSIPPQLTSNSILSSTVPMGAGASISHELLLEDGHRSQLLTKEALSELQRSSASAFANPQTLRLAPVLPNTSSASQEEIPTHVTNLLLKFGIDVSAYQQNDLPASQQLSSTTKLVGHIFDCLGALQILVRANQALFPEEDETQSVAELGTKSIGKLVHEMIQIYGLCRDTLKILLAASPEAASVEDSFGRLPLHAAVDMENPWLSAVDTIVQSFPQALLRRDGGGRLPLHVAVDKCVPDVNVVDLLVKVDPDAACARRGVGRLPLHNIMFCDSIPLQTLESLCRAYPDGVKTKDAYGRLPLHYAVDKSNPQASVVRYLLQLYPDAAAVKDSHMRYPLTIAVDKEGVDVDVIRPLCESFPQALTIPGLHQRLPLHVAVAAPTPSASCVEYLIRQCPDAVSAVCEASGKDKESLQYAGTPIDIIRSRKDHRLMRLALLTVPRRLLEPSWLQLLKDRNWQSRKIAFLLVNKRFCCPSPELALVSPDDPDSPRRLSQLRLSFRSGSQCWAGQDLDPVVMQQQCRPGNRVRSISGSSHSELTGSPGGRVPKVRARLTIVGAHAILSNLFTSNEIIFRVVVNYL